MTDDRTPGPDELRMSRRGLLAGSGLAAAATVVAALGDSASVADAGPVTGSTPSAETAVPFVGTHQAGIATRQQPFLAFAAYDLATSDPGTFGALLRTWTAAAERLTSGRTLAGDPALFAPPGDSGEALGVGACRLTLTVGFGPSLFDARLGLSAHRPAVLVDLPPFAGDQLDPARTGGDLCVQACADDPRVAFHAVRNLTRLASDAATLRWVQVGAGTTTRPATGASPPRNLLGFHDGTANLDPSDEAAMDRAVWVDRADQQWMAGGTYLVARRIRIHLESWDRTTLEAQQLTVGRVKATGAPLGSRSLDDPVDLDALGADGQPLIPNDAHVRQASPTRNGGAQLLRRGYTYVDAVDPASGEVDAGLFFVCFQQDPTRQFVPIQRRLSESDALATYLVHTGGGVFACPPGVAAGEPWAAGLLRAAGV